MRKIKNKNLAELLLQLRFTPEKKRRKQLDSAEKLTAEIDGSKEYPFEFVCFRITGFHPKGPQDPEPIKGEELIEDLATFISQLSGRLAIPAAGQTQKVHTIDELAENMAVSTKTIDRWRKRGLVAQKFVFDDGKKRLGFLQSSLDRFVKANPSLVDKAKNFARLATSQKQRIIKKAAALQKKTRLSRYQVIEQLSAQTHRSHETIRYLLLKHDKAKSRALSDSAESDQPPGIISPAASAELYKLFKQGSGIKELMKRSNRSKSSVYRIINRRRAKALLAQKIEYIHSDEFLDDNAKEKIHANPPELLTSDTDRNSKTLKLTAGSIPEYFQILKASPVLNRQREVELFRRYNFLKYLACKTREKINISCVRSAQLNEIEDYLAQAEAIKKRIIEANLRLVVSIAKKHTLSGANLQDLISEGNFSLMRAVEKFDYTKGFRFTTYASWAIAKDFARKIPAEAYRPDKATTASMANVQRNFRITEAADFVAVEHARKSLVQVIKEELDQREQYIILNHFGLIGSLVKKDKKTLKQIGDHLGLTRERVRQIELTALQKLRQSLSIEEFELLTG